MKLKRFLKGTVVAAAVAAAAWAVPSAEAAETKGPVTDDIGVVMIPKGAPIFIGGYWTISGPDTALGLDQQRGLHAVQRRKHGATLGERRAQGPQAPHTALEHCFLHLRSLHMAAAHPEGGSRLTTVRGQALTNSESLGGGHRRDHQASAPRW